MVRAIEAELRLGPDREPDRIDQMLDELTDRCDHLGLDPGWRPFLVQARAENAADGKRSTPHSNAHPRHPGTTSRQPGLHPEQTGTVRGREADVDVPRGTSVTVTTTISNRLGRLTLLRAPVCRWQ